MEVHSRKLLSQINLNTLTSIPPPPALSPNQYKLKQIQPEIVLAKTQPDSRLNADVVLVLSILLCGLICAIAVNIIVRCILRLTTRTCNQESLESSLNDEIQTQPSTRIRRKEALQALPRLVYSSTVELTGSGSQCTICLSEFKPGVHLRVLPVCHHGFHVGCIDKWLSTQSTCPTCRRCLFGTNQQDVSQVVPTVDRVRVEPEEEMQV
ncbi:RING-H2 finger protein ATL78 [Rhynchospora pubera]|uniref:RING-H2 finger protein ATL78 n=1 Tax=Rhynchospora pubera TaxID=906938 RepID=A0AAV8H6R6_9POAL|nr:RING-H2 finger protein ATL78 [Rhynchospora pubera]